MGDFDKDSTLFPAKCSVVIQARWGRALLSCQISPRNPVFSRLCATVSEISDRQFITYDGALIEASGSNAIDSIRLDFMKEIVTIRFPELLSDEDHLLTGTLFTAVWLQDNNDETMIHHQ